MFTIEDILIPAETVKLTRDGHGREVADGQREADGHGVQRPVGEQERRVRLLLLDEGVVDGNENWDEQRDGEDDVIDHRDLLGLVHDDDDVDVDGVDVDCAVVDDVVVDDVIEA